MDKHVSGLRTKVFPRVNILGVYSADLPAWWVHKFQMCQTEQLSWNESLMWYSHHGPHICPSISSAFSLTCQYREWPSMCQFRAPEINRKINSWPAVSQTIKLQPGTDPFHGKRWGHADTGQTKMIENRGTTAETWNCTCNCKESNNKAWG